MAVSYWDALVNEVACQSDAQDGVVFSPLSVKKEARAASSHAAPRRDPWAASRGPQPRFYLFEGRVDSVYLTRREAQCIALLLRGCTMVRAAGYLQLSSRTVEFYVKNVRIKTCMETTAQLLDFVRQTDFAKKMEASSCALHNIDGFFRGEC